MTPLAMRCGGYQGATSVHTRGLQVLATALRKLSDGAVHTVVTQDVTADGNKATDLLARVEHGTLDLCYFASSYLADRVPALAVFDLPFLLLDRASAYESLDGNLGDHLAAAVGAGTGFAVLGFWDNGTRHLSNRPHPIAHPRDCEGLSIRTLDSPLHQELFGSFGFRPVALDVRDLGEAVRSHRVDAQENPLTNTVNFGLHRTHPFHSLTSHLLGVALLLVNRAWHDGLPSQARAVLRQAVVEATQAQRGFAAGEDERCLGVLHEAGAHVLGPEDLDLSAFQDAVAGLKRRELERLDPTLRRALPNH